jgi:hypothetical protein
MIPGYNLVGSMVPVSGDLANTNQPVGAIANLNLTPGYFDYILFCNPATQAFVPQSPTEGGMYSPGWIAGNGIDPVTTNVAEGFYYYNNQGAGHPEKWIENFTINP